MKESRGKRARRLGRASWELIRSDRRLIAFPLVGSIVGLVLGGAAFALSYTLLGGHGLGHGQSHSRAVIVIGGLIATYPVTFVTLFCGVALAEVLRRSLAGEPASAADGWRAARSRLGLIAAWTLLVCTVGAFLRLVEERIPLGGKLAAALAGVAWSLATMFAVPVIAYENLGPMETLRRSAALFRERWGEQLGGAVTIGAGAGLVMIPAVLCIVVGVSVGGPSGIVLVVVGGALVIGIQAFASALNEVYRVFLYRSAVGIEPVGGPFDEHDLSRPTWGKRRRD